jgi:hypothetical protein
MRRLDASVPADVIPTPPAPWRLLAIDALVADGVAALWHDPSTGTLAVLPVDFDPGRPEGFALASAGGYRPLGLAEIDGDAVREIAMASPDGRVLEFWKVSDGEIVPAGGVPVRPDWRLAKAADLDGDGVSDLWWQTSVPGVIEVWKVSMTDLLDVLLRVFTDAEGDLVEVADFDGDGVADGLWRDPVWGVLTIGHLRPGGGGDLGALEELVGLPWVPGDADLLVRAAADLDNSPGAEILVQDRSTYRVHAIFPDAGAEPERAVLFDVAPKSELVLVR